MLVTYNAKSSPPVNESGLNHHPYGNGGTGGPQGQRCSVDSKVNLLAEMNGSQGRTGDEPGVVSGDARNATCWGNPKQKQSWMIRDREVAWTKQGTNNPAKDIRVYA